MAYASASHVAGKTGPNILDGASNFSASTNPTIFAVNNWLSSGCSVIESELTARGYTMPVTNSMNVYDRIVDLNALYAAAWAELSRVTVTVTTGERTRGQIYMDMFDSQLMKLVDGDLTQSGLTRSSNAKIYTGGISVSTKQTNEKKTDRVKPRFSREAFKTPGTLYPSGTTASQT